MLKIEEWDLIYGFDMSSKAMKDAEKTAGIKKAVEVDYDYRRYSIGT
jgi:hypothetical protein